MCNRKGIKYYFRCSCCCVYKLPPCLGGVAIWLQPWRVSGTTSVNVRCILPEPVSWCGSHMVVALDVDVLYQYIKCFVVPMDLECVREKRDIILIPL